MEEITNNVVLGVEKGKKQKESGVAGLVGFAAGGGGMQKTL